VGEILTFSGEALTIGDRKFLVVPEGIGHIGLELVPGR
jgi:hypothetical protein